MVFDHLSVGVWAWTDGKFAHRTRRANAAEGPTAENALAAEKEIARAMRNNDADGITRFLADDWAVIATSGGVGEGKSVFADGIKSGFLTRKHSKVRNLELGAKPNLRAVSYRNGSVTPVTLAITKLSSFSFLTGISSWYKDRTWKGSISDRRAKYLFRLCEQRSHDRCHQFLIPLEAKVIPATS